MLIRFLAALCGGIAMWLAHEPISWWYLAFLAIAMLWWAVFERGVVTAFALGWLWGFAFFLPLFHWAEPATGTYLAQFALAAAQAVYIGVLGAIWALISRFHGGSSFSPIVRTVIQVGLASVTWLAMEQLRSTWPLGGMPWGTLAFAFVDSPLIHLAPYGSTQLVGGGALVVALLVAIGVQMSFLAGAGAVLVGITVVVATLFVPIGARPEETLHVAVVQGNIPPESAPNRALTVTANHVAATRELVAGVEVPPDLILWPESSSDRDVRQDPQAREAVFTMVDELGVALVMGTQEYTDGGRYNDVLVIVPGEGVTDRYSKQHPVPFGEYIPHRDFFRNFTDAVDLVSIDMYPGRGRAVVEAPTEAGNVQLAVPICFEVAYDDIVASAVRAGSELIVIPTNNASFGRSGLSDQQFAMSQFRAIEHSRTVIQVSTSGITGVVNSRGQVLYETEPFTQDARIVEVGLHSGITMAAQTERVRVGTIYILGAAGTMVGVAHAISQRRRT